MCMALLKAVNGVSVKGLSKSILKLNTNNKMTQDTTQRSKLVSNCFVITCLSTVLENFTVISEV